MTDEEKQDILNDYKLYLDKVVSLSPKARSNDMSWIRSLMQRHDIFSVSTQKDVDRMMDYEAYLMKQPERQSNKTSKALTNFRHTMKYFLPFMNCWRIAQEAKLRAKPFDDMIDQISRQSCLAHATTVCEATIFCAFQQDYHFTAEQKTRLMANMAKFDARFAVEKFFGPGSTYYNHAQ